MEIRVLRFRMCIVLQKLINFQKKNAILKQRKKTTYPWADSRLNIL